MDASEDVHGLRVWGRVGLPCDFTVREEDCSEVLVWPLERDARSNQAGPTCMLPMESEKGFQVSF